MDLGLRGKRVLLAGASRGIGFAMARAFVAEGAQVALIARGTDALADASRALLAEHTDANVLTFPIDCANDADWPPVAARIAAEWGGLDIAVANAGDGRGPPDAIPAAERFAQAWRANFTTAEATARATAPLLADGGALLFVSSIAGLEFVGAPTDYSVAKGAVIALSKQMARRLAPRVRVNCLAPGNVLFPGGSWDEKVKGDTERVTKLIESTVPMRRFAKVDEIAHAALFLCSDRASFITGACLVIDGGQTVGMH